MAAYYTDTKNKLSAAVWKLMEIDILENITITQICQEAKTSRRSFYRHFQSKRSVIEYGFRKKGEEFIRQCAECKTFEEIIGRSFQLFKEQKKHLHLLQQNDLMPELYHIIQNGDLFSKELDIFMERSSLPAYLREYVANVIAASHTSLLITWADHNFSADWREIAKFEIGMFSVMAD